MSNGVHITGYEKISIPRLSETPPSIKLSFFDAIWIPLKPVQKVLIYSTLKTDVSFSTILENIKSSLSSVLLDYLPLAGKLTYLLHTEDVEIDLSDLGFTFVEAESNLDVQQLSFNEIIDAVSFSKLVPVVDVSVLPFHVLAVQVTRFENGGVAVGYSIHHMAADGNATTKFVQAWSRVCKAKLNGIEQSNVYLPSLTYDRGVIKHPKAEQIKRAIFRSNAPSLPSTKHPSLTDRLEKRSELSRRTFHISKQSINLLKQRGTDQGRMQMKLRIAGSVTGTDSTSQVVPSTFSALSAYIWGTVARTKSFDPKEETVFCITMDCRTRLNPPIPDGYIGNCICAVTTNIMTGDLIAEDGMVIACKAIRESVDRVGKDPLVDCEDWVDVFARLPFGRLVNASSSPKFRVYENDFGWGKPDRFEMVSMNTDGEFVLVAGKEEGTVQMTIAIGPDQLDMFSSLFLEGLDG